MTTSPVPGSYMLSAKLSCLFMAPDGALQSWDVHLDIPADSASQKRTSKNKKRLKNKKRRLRKKQNKTRLQCKPAWQSSCSEHVPEKVFPTGFRDNSEWSWRCAICKVEL